MKTSLDCLHCMMGQALKTARIVTGDPSVQHRIMIQAGALLADMNLALSPPENAMALYRMISRESGSSDPFQQLKEQGNRFACSLRDGMQQAINQADDPLFTALRFAVCGNIIDHAAQHRFDAAASMARCQEARFLINHYPRLQARLQAPRVSRNLLYIADNCGEIVFDGLCIAELQKLGWQVTLAVRGDNIINDATRGDLQACGLANMCPVIDSGVACPGTPLALCSEALRNAFARADCIISKGMGNFETLSEEPGPIFFLFTVKCTVVARHLAELHRIPLERINRHGDMVILAGESG